VALPEKRGTAQTIQLIFTSGKKELFFLARLDKSSENQPSAKSIEQKRCVYMNASCDEMKIAGSASKC
jgi:hypothetical protein